MTTTSILERAPVSFTRQRILDYLELTKPRLTALVLVTAAAGFWMGLGSMEHLPLLASLLGGMALAVGGANALNQWSERVPDGLMPRTKHRPLPSGRIEPEAAKRYGVGLCVGGVLWLAMAVNILAAALTTLSIASYVLVYTPLKRVTPLCTLVGAIPGALPPLIGWAAARSSLSLEAWALFAILFVWQLPHFLAIAFLYRDEYARAGFQMLPIIDSEGMAAAREMVLYGLVLIPVSLFPTFLGLAGSVYFACAFLLSVGLLCFGVRAALHRTQAPVRHLFLASVIFLPLLLGVLSLDKGGAVAAVVRRVIAPPSALPAQYGAVPPFALTDQRNRVVTGETLRGRVWIADFIFTSCAGQCPLMSESMRSLQQAFPNEPQLSFVSFSVDPSRDTPERLTVYAARYGADARWTLLTGAREAIQRLCVQGFRLAFDEQPEVAQEPILHSVRLVLVDRAGQIRGYYDATDAEAMSRVRRDIARLLRDPT
ncbi:MAG: heme o synthase [Candidatus Omnitrophota bacterium]|nr:heme o synthase [Candidatus Omnitrophota bacterium]